MSENKSNSGTSFTADRSRGTNQYNQSGQGKNSGADAKPRFKIKDGNIIRINPDGTTTSRPLTDDERRRLEEARANAARARREEESTAQRRGNGMDEAARRQADQRYLVRNQSEAASQLGVNSQAQRRRGEEARREQNERARRKRRIRINPGAVVFVLLMAAVIGISVRQIGINEAAKANKETTDLVYSGDEGETHAYLSETEAESADGNEEENLTLFDTVNVSNTGVHEGDLILVNYENAYITPASLELTNAYEERTGVAETGRLKVSKTSISMQSEAFGALERLVVDMMSDTGCSDLMIVSGYRTIDEQTEIYADYVEQYGADYAKAYVADPGYSEHHTGLCCDLTFYTAEGYSVPISEHEYGYWLGENCMREGFIRRYPEEKADITKISYEAWHFRYVGIPHAYAITSLGYCLEEYIDYLRAFNADTQLLHIKSDYSLETVSSSSIAESGVEGGWLVYFVPASEEASTDIPVLRGEKYSEYELSGNNSDGFIVTLRVK